MENQKKSSMEIFSPEELDAAITLKEVESMLSKDQALTPYHFEVLKLEIAFRENMKADLAKGMYGKDGKLLQSKKAANNRVKLIQVFEEQQRLQNLQSKAKRLYRDFKALRAAGQTPPELSKIFRETLDKLWAARRQMNAQKHVNDIEANLDAYLAKFNAEHHAG